ncbi:MAG: DUF1595 domain-containing protein, partial [Myxococcota bacterium]
MPGTTTMMRTPLLCAALTATTACYSGGATSGAADGTDGTDGSGADDDGGSDGDDAGIADEAVLPRDIQRLTRYEHLRTIEALFGAEVLAAVEVRAQLLPADEMIGRFDAEAQDITPAHVSAYAALATAVAEAVLDIDSARNTVVPCFDGGAGLPCLDTLVADYGPRILRRPLHDEELESYRGLYLAVADASERDAFVAVLAAMLQSPDFVFKMELGSDPGADDEVFTLTSDEVANRMAYYAWGQPPDDGL